jgi:hypothetical protein
MGDPLAVFDPRLVALDQRERLGASAKSTSISLTGAVDVTGSDSDCPASSTSPAAISSVGWRVSTPTVSNDQGQVHDSAVGHRTVCQGPADDPPAIARRHADRAASVGAQRKLAQPAATAAADPADEPPRIWPRSPVWGSKCWPPANEYASSPVMVLPITVAPAATS